MVVVPITWINF